MSCCFLQERAGDFRCVIRKCWRLWRGSLNSRMSWSTTPLFTPSLTISITLWKPDSSVTFDWRSRFILYTIPRMSYISTQTFSFCSLFATSLCMFIFAFFEMILFLFFNKIMWITFYYWDRLIRLLLCYTSSECHYVHYTLDVCCAAWVNHGLSHTLQMKRKVELWRSETSGDELKSVRFLHVIHLCKCVSDVINDTVMCF